jgi:hypothetical protein
MGRMKCPSCGENTPDAWLAFVATEPAEGGGYTNALNLPSGTGVHRRRVSLDWMHCANPRCEQLVIRMHDAFMAYEDGRPVGNTEESFLVRPRASVPRIYGGEVPDDLFGEPGAYR